jgi:hypothetical protein
MDGKRKTKTTGQRWRGSGKKGEEAEGRREEGSGKTERTTGEIGWSDE